VKFSIILKYLQAFGWPWVWLVVATYLGQNLVSIGQNLWLSAWAREAKHWNEFTEWKQIRNNKLNTYGLLGLVQGKNIVHLLFFFFHSDLIDLNIRI
jgi:ATP-binding cassette subfamily C (CFTR/MRP) protein 2